MKRVWFSDDGERSAAARERVLPTGCMHLVIRLSAPLHLFDGIDDLRGRTVDHAIVGGARAAFYVRDISK
ncbi:MAG: helix-turn-helix transcriptional regulator, partial [Steroidobacteraceae bacterium]